MIVLQEKLTTLFNEDYSIQEQSGYADNLDLDKEAGFDTSSTADDILDLKKSFW